MKGKIKNAWEYVKEHKVEILVGACYVTGIAMIGKFFYKASKSTGTSIVQASPSDPITSTRIFPNIGVGSLDDAIRYSDGAIELWMDNLTIADIGKLGEGIVEAFPDIPENAKVWALMDIREGRNQ